MLVDRRPAGRAQRRVLWLAREAQNRRCGVFPSAGEPVDACGTGGGVRVRVDRMVEAVLLLRCEQAVFGVPDRRRPPIVAVTVAAAPSGEVLFSTRGDSQVVGRRLAELAEEVDLFRRDGRVYPASEWPLARTIASGEEVVDEELVLMGPDGDRLIYSADSVPLYDSEGQIVAGVSVTRDVTEESHRQERGAFLEGLLQSTEDGIIAVNAGGFVTVWNRGAERMYGLTADEVIGRHMLTVSSLAMTVEERVAALRAAADHGHWRGETFAHRHDGTSISVELVTVALRSEEGDVTGFLAIHRDITERKRAEEALRDSQRRAETILESITEAFVAVDREWRYTYVNERALRRIRGRKGEPLTREDVLGKGMWEMFPDVVGTQIYDGYREAMREQHAVTFEVYFEPTDEWIEAHTFPSEAGLSIYYKNVDDRKRAEQRVVEAPEAERTRIARALHDEALQGLADALVLATGAPGTPDSRPNDQLVSALRRVGEQLRGAIYDLRLGGEEHKSFPELLEELVEVQRETAAGGEIVLDMGDGVPTGSLGDTGLDVLRIIGEALTNARRHADARHVRVRVWAKKAGLCAEVSDDGRGFDATTPPSSLHHGIRGMQERAELLGGHLKIRSEPGAGTRVRLKAILINDGPSQTDPDRRTGV
jgi:PAS domain S-box-containing protein